mgnify:CR=1 FL=1
MENEEQIECVLDWLCEVAKIFRNYSLGVYCSDENIAADYDL